MVGFAHHPKINKKEDSQKATGLWRSQRFPFSKYYTLILGQFGVSGFKSELQHFYYEAFTFSLVCFQQFHKAFHCSHTETSYEFCNAFYLLFVSKTVGKVPYTPLLWRGFLCGTFLRFSGWGKMSEATSAGAAVVGTEFVQLRRPWCFDRQVTWAGSPAKWAEKLRLGIGLDVGSSPNFVVPLLNEISASVSLSIKWGTSNDISYCKSLQSRWQARSKRCC